MEEGYAVLLSVDKNNSKEKYQADVVHGLTARGKSIVKVYVRDKIRKEGEYFLWTESELDLKFIYDTARKTEEGSMILKIS